jgi:hypothetical protein
MISSSLGLCLASRPVRGSVFTTRAGLGWPTCSRALAFTALVAENRPGFRFVVALRFVMANDEYGLSPGKRPQPFLYWFPVVSKNPFTPRIAFGSIIAGVLDIELDFFDGSSRALSRVADNPPGALFEALFQFRKCHSASTAASKTQTTITQMKVPWQTKVALILAVTTVAAVAQSPAVDSTSAKQTQLRGYWADPSTKLRWAGKDNGKDVSWKGAVKYCRNLRLAGYLGWRLATLSELEGIYNKNANAPGLARLGGPAKGSDFTWHVKGNLFLTGNQWSSSQRLDDRGHPSGYAWRFDFNEGQTFDGDEVTFHTNKRALCVRGPG